MEPEIGIFSGRFGAGTKNPKTLIHVLGTDTENNSLYVSSEDIDKRLAFKHQGTTGEIFSRNYSTSVYNDLLLNKNFLIKDSGRVKIGDVTNNPVEALEISGALRLTGASATQMDGTIIYNTIGSTTDFFGRKQGEWVPLTSINKVKAGGGLVIDNDGFSISNIDPLLIGRGSVDKETFFYLTNVNKDIQLQFDDITKQLVFDNTPTENSNNLVRSGAVFSFLAGKQDKFTPESRLDARALGDGGITNRTLSYLINVESDIQVQINNITNYDTVPKANSLQGVTSKGIFEALALKAEAYTQDNRLEAIAIGDGTVTNTAFGYLSNVKSDIQQQIDAIPGASAADNFPTAGSENFVKSSGIHTRLSEKHPLLTVTNTLDPTLIGDGSVSTTTFGYLANVNKDIQFQLDNVTDNIVYDNTPIQNSQNPLTSGSLFVELGKKQDTITTSNLLDASLIGDGTIHNQTLGYIRNLKGDIEDRFSEITTIAQDKTPITTYIVTVEGNPKKFYIDGVEAPQLTFIPGSTYRFNVSSVTTANYRFYVTTTNGGGGGLVGVTNGITNNGIDFNSTNTMLTYKVPHYPTGKIYYASIDQTNMGNRINVIDQALQKTDNVTFNDMTISGNLTVSGNQTIVNTSTISVEDPVITIGSNTTDDNLDRGVEFKYNDGSAKVGFMGWDDSTSRFVLLKDATNTNEVFTGTDADLQAAKGLFSGDIIVGGNKFQVSSTNGTTSVGGQLFVTGNSSISGTLTMDSNKITNVTDPTDAQDASTKAYVDSKTQNIPSGATLTLPKINDSNSSHKYEFAVNDLTADRTMTLPLLTGNDEFVFKDHTQTLTNKTLTSPVVTGGTINNTPIGGSVPNTGAFTTINASSNVTIGGSQTTTGLTNSNGGIAVDTDKFTVATSGNTITKGTLTVSGTGATTLGGALDVTGLTTTAGITASGLLNANAGIAVDTDKFTVADTSGNVSTKGTLSVESTTTLTGDVTVSNLKLNANDAANKTMTVNATNSHATGEGKLVLSASDEVVVTDGIATVKLDGGVLSTVTSSIDLDSNGAVSINSSGGVINIGNDNVNGDINIANSGSRNVVLGTTTTNLDINSAGATIDSTTLAINSTNTTGITMTANDASTRKITIQAKNSTANHVGEINMIADGDISIVPGSSDGTTGSSKVLKVDSTAAIRVPVGTTAQRNIASNETDAALKAAAKGSIRYNTNTLTFEGYNGGTWGSLGGVKDVDQDTLITSESTPGADEDTLTFQTGGTKRATMDASGNFDVYDSTGTNSKFKVTNAGNTTIGGTLGVNSTSTMTGLLNANGGIAVNTDKFTVAANGNTTTDGTLSSKSDFKVNTNKFVVIGTSGNTTVAGTMDITGDTGIDGDFDIATNKFTVASGTGNTTVAGTLEIEGNTGINGNFDIATNKFTVASGTGNTAVAGTLDVTGLTTTAGITASGLLNANAGIAVDTNKFTVADGTGNTSINGTLSVNSTVGISGDTTLNDANLIIKNSGAADKFKVLAASGNTDIKGTLDTAGDFKVASNKFTVASGTGNTTVAGTLDVTGNTGIDGDFDIATDKFTVASGTGNTTVAGTLGVTGLTTTAGITASGLLNANGGIATDTDKFTVATNGNTVTKGTLTVSGTGATTLGGDLSVGGTNFQVVATSGNTSIAGTLTSDGNVTVENATLKVRDGSSNDKFTVAANGNTTVGGTLGVTGVSTMTGLTNANGGIAVDTDKFTVATNGNTVTKGTLTVSGTGATELGGSLTVTGTSTFNDNVSISGNKTLTVGTGLTTLGGNLQVDGNLTISGTTTTVNTSTITVEDPVITVGTNASDDNKDRGVEIKWHDGTGSKIGFFGMDDSTGEFTFIQDATNTNEVFSGTAGNAKFTNMTLGGTLGVTGTSTLSGLLNANGGIAVDTNKFTVADGSGNTAIAGTLNVTGNTTVSTISTSGQIDMNSNKIVNVTDPTSNQDVATKKYVDDQTTAIPANALLTTPRINDSSSDNYYQFSPSELTANRTVTLPLLTGDDEFVFKDHTQTLTNKTLTNPDINGGTIDSATIATSDITVGAGKTLNVSAGTLTLADNQISGDKVEGGTIAGITITTLGSTTVNSTTVDTTNIEVTNIKAKDGTAAATIADSTGVVTIGSSVLTTTDINGGTIDNATIATSDITVGTGKTLNVSAGTLTLADNQISGDKVEGGTIAGITITTLSSTTGNITTVNSTTVDTTNVEVTNIKAKDGTSAATVADSTGVVTIPSSVLTTTDINGGTIDNATIGANTPAAITGTTITANTNFVGNVTGNVTGTVSSIANHDTSDLSEGTNLYHTTARARASVSVTDSGGDGSLAYNSTSGVITYTGPSAAETRAHFSAGTGVGISGGEISIGQAVGTTDNVTFGNIAGTLTTAAQANITTMTGLVSVGSTGNTTTFSGPILADEGLKVDTISEDTTGSGVTIDGVVLKDNSITASGGVTADLTGNAATATKLETARTIAGQSFDGSANITIASTDLSDASTFTAPKSTILATARTIGGVSFNGSSNIDLPGVNTSGNQDTSGNAATATVLATARTIGGVSFDGSSNIDLPGVNTAGNQDTSGNAATATKLAATKTIAGQSFDGSANITIASTNLSDASTFTAPKSTILATARTIAGQSFDGSANITIASTDLSDASTFTAPKSTILATARTIGGVSFDGSSNIDLPGVNTSGNQDTSGNAATSTVLATARTIGGVSFDGSSNIDLPGVNVSGNQDTSGNAATATVLATARTIGGVSFDGSSNINLPGVNASGNQDTSGNAATATKLAATKNIGGVAFDGSANINLPGVNASGNQDTSGNAATATALATARTIGGVSFDGSANINLPGVNASGNQDTSGNAATATKLAASKTIGGVAFDGSANINLPGVNASGNQDTSGNAATATVLATARTIGGVSFDGSANINLPGVNTTGNQDTSGNAATATTAGTVTTAAQPSITSVGTLTGLTVNGSVSANTITINNAATNTNHAVTKGYVDSVASGLDVKKSVRVATTTNGTLASSFANGQTVDGITLATGDRILIKNQTTGSENGIYTVNASGAPTRATDFDDNTEVTSGAFTFVEEGTVNADNGFALTTDGSITVGTTALVFTQFTGAGSITAGSGLSQTGNTIDVNVDGSSLEVSSDTMRVKSGGITNTMLANNTISFGGVSLALGGTDATPAFNLSDATNYPTSSLTGTITNTQLAGSIANDKLSNNTVSFGGVSLALGGSDATPAFDLSDATNYPTSSLTGTITNAQLAGSIANSKLANNTVSFGGVSLALGGSDATPAFDLSDATNYPTSSLTGTITNTQLAGSIANDKLANNTVSFGGVSLALGATDATPAFNLSDATGYPTSSLTGTITNAQLAGSIANDKLANNTVSFGGISLALGATDATPAFDLSDATNYPTSSLSGTITNAQLAGSITNSKLANSGKLNDSTNVFYSEATITANGGKFYVDGTQQQELHLQKGMTYRFNQSDSSNNSHPFYFSTTSDGTHNSGSKYTTGVTEVGTPGSSGSYTQIIVQQDTPTLYYYCGNHSGMGGKAVIDIQEKLTTGSVTNDMLAGTIPIAKGGTGATTASAARTALGVDAAGTDNSTDVTLASVSGNYLTLSGQQITAGTVPLSLGGTGATTASAARTALGVDAAGTDNSTNVTLATVSGNYLTLSGQQITAGTVPISLGGTGATTASAARTALGVDAAGTDNSTDVTLATVSNNYLSLSGQTITAGTIPVSLGGTGATSASAARTALGAIDGLTVKQDSTTNSNDATYTSITTLIFDYDAGLQVSNPSTGEAKITLGSHWKTIQIDGTNAVTPSGEETLNLIKGTGINITGNSGSTPQSLTFSINAALNDLSNVSAGSPSTNDVLKWNGSSWVPGTVSGGATSLNGLSDVLVENNSVFLGSDPSSSTDTAEKNVAVGIGALDSITTGDGNVAVGYNSMSSNTTASFNVAIGRETLLNSSNKDYLVAIGFQSMQNASGNLNTAIGYQTLPNTTGHYNTVVGYQAGNDITSGNHNTLLGMSSGDKITTGTSNVIIGSNAGGTLTTGGNNVLIGKSAEVSANDSSNAIVIGNGSTGHGNNIVVIGNSSITAWHPGDDNGVDLGSTSYSFKDAHIQGVIYASTLNNGTSFTLPTADGTNGQFLKTNGSGTLSWGDASSGGASSLNGLSDVLIENNSIFLGSDPSSTTNNAEYNVSLGINALDSITTGDNNVAVGYNSLTANTEGSENVSIGYDSLKDNTTGEYNISLGSEALTKNTTGGDNIAIGYRVLKENTTSNGNIGIGKQALVENTTGSNNVSIGKSSMLSNTTGNGNVSLGRSSLESNTTGGYNTVIGAYAGDTLTTGNYNVLIGNDADTTSSNVENVIVIGNEARDHGSNIAVIGNSSITAWHPGDDNGVDLGSASYSFKDAHIQGVIHATQIKTGTPTFTLPTADGSSGQFLKTDGNGTLSWGTASGGGGSGSFTGLSDTPSSFSGQGGKFLKVNSTPNAVEFASFSLSDIPSGGASTGQVLKWSGSAWAPGTDNTGSGGGGGGGGSSTGTLGVYNATGDAKVMIETDGSNASDVAKLVLQKGTAVANLSWNGTTLEVDKSLNLSSTLKLGSTLTASSANSDVLLVGSGTDFQVKKTSVALSSLLTTSSTSVGTLSSLTVSGDATFDTSTLKVDSTNNRVGIGTTSPDTMLHLKSTGDVVLRLEADSNNAGENDNPMIFMSQDGSSANQQFKIGMNGDAGATFTGALGNAAYLYTPGDTHMQFGVHGEALMTLKYDTLNVGIGTDSPQGKLEVIETDTTNNDISYPLILDHRTSSGTPANGIGTGIRFDCQRNASSGYEYQDNCATIAVYGAQNMNTTDDQWNLKFTVRDNDTFRTPMVMKYDGNVGIGDTTPSYKLDVNGTGRFTGDLTAGANLTVTGNLTVNGTTTTVSTTNMVVSDSLIELNSGASSNANDCGIVIERGSTGDNAFMGWDESADKFLMGTTTATGASTGNLSVTTGTLVANLEGNVTGNATTVTNGVYTTSSVTALSDVSNVGSGSIITSSERTKLAGIATSANNYSLPTASGSALGGVKVGTGLSISSGVLSVTSSGKWSGSTDIYYTSGDVGIGTTSPDAKLHINGGKLLIIDNPSSSGAGEGRILGGHTDNAHAIHFRKGEDGTTDVLDFHEYGKIRFYTNGALSSQTEKMCILSNGNVGIGTASPNAPLEIHGGAGDGDEVLILSNSKDSSNTGLHAIFLDGGHHYDVYNSSTIQDGKSTSNGSNYHMNRYSAGDVTMVVGGGNVGIGDTTPTYKLDVNGTGRFTGALTANVTGNLTGSVLTASQTAITSVGTLGSLTVSGDATFDTSTLKVDSSNNRVGIGTTSPSAPLEIKCTAGTNTHNEQWTGAKGLRLARSSDGYAWEMVNGRQNDLLFRNIKSDGTVYTDNVLMLDDNGKVGIGTNSPSYKLDVAGDINLTGDISISGTDLGLNHLSDASVSGNEITLGISTTTAILPSPNGTVDLGSSSKKFDVLYASKLNNGVSFTLPTADGTSGQFLKTDGSGTLSWGTASGGGASALNDLSDVSTSGAQANYALVYNGSSWAPAAQSGSGGSSSSEYYSAHIQNISDTNRYTGYTASASSSLDNTVYNPDNVFFHAEGYIQDDAGVWISALKYSGGSYTGSESTNSYNGEWVQINFGKKVKVYSYGIRGPTQSTTLFHRSPGGYKLFASNDGSSWTDVHTGSASLTDYNANYQKMKHNTLSTPVTYQYFRLVTNSLVGTNTNHAKYVAIFYLAFFGTFEEPDLIKGAISANVVHQRMTETATLSVAADGGKTEIEGLRLTITPQSSSSKLELNYSIFNQFSNHNAGFVVSRTVGGTETFLTTNHTSSSTYDLTFIHSSSMSDYTTQPMTTSHSMIDEPNTTGVVVYKVYGKSSGGTAITLYINRTGSDSNDTNFEHGISTSSVKEFSTFTHNIAEQKVKGRVLEVLRGKCDGSVVTVGSGSYTMPVQTFTHGYTLPNTMTADPASLINYKAPKGTDRIIFKYKPNMGYQDTRPLIWYQLAINDTLIDSTYTKYNAGSQAVNSYEFEALITKSMVTDITSTNKYQFHARCLDSSNQVGYYKDAFENNSADDFTSQDYIEITAIGEENLVYNLTNQYSITEGQVLETLAGVCDGRSVTVSSGTYTLEDVTTYLETTTTWTKLTGSEINYKPPVGTKQVIYNLSAFQGYANDSYCHQFARFFIDGQEVTKQHLGGWGGSTATYGNIINFKFVIDIGTTDDIANGRVSSWDALKTLKVEVRDYNTDSRYSQRYHRNSYQVPPDSNASGSNSTDYGYSLTRPKLEIQAIGRGVIEGTIGNLYSSKVNMDHVTYSTAKTITIDSSIPGTEVEDLRLTLKPTATDSVIELKWNIFGELHQDTLFRVTRNYNGTDTLIIPATNIWEGAVGMTVYDNQGVNSNTPQMQTIMMYDEPNTTQTVTYKVWASKSRTDNPSNHYADKFYLNGTRSTGAAQAERGSSFGAAIELPQQTTLHNPRYNSVIEQEGQVLETLEGVCDGRSVTVSSGTYTLDNVTTYQSLTKAITTATGSTINYKPPSGTKQVIYEFYFSSCSDNLDDHSIQAYLEIDGTKCTNQQRMIGSWNAYTSTSVFKIVFDIGNVSSDDLANAKLANWDTLKQLRIKVRSHIDSNTQGRLHTVNQWTTGEQTGSNSSNGRVNITSSNISSYLYKPTLKIKAIGRKSDTTFLNSFFNERKGQVLETLSGTCDGRTITVDSGTYTLANITTGTSVDGTTYVDFPGSSISYKPPAGTKQVIYKFHSVYGRISSNTSVGFTFFIDDTEVTSFREYFGAAGDYSNNVNQSYVINIDGTDDIPNGRLSSWDALKTLKIKVASQSGYGIYINKRRYEIRDGVSGSHSSTTLTDYLYKPNLEIQAIGDAAIQNATVVAGNSMIHFQGYSNSRKSFTLDTGTAKSNTFYDYSYHSGTGAYNMIQYKNIGGCMNNSTGEFTFPHTGLYSINMTAQMSDSDNNPRTYVYWQMNKTKGTYEGSAEPNVLLCELPGFRERSTSSKILHFQAGESFIIHSGQSTQPEDIYLSITALQDQVPQAISARPGMTLETLAGVCDGRTVTVSSGTYTLENITTGTKIDESAPNFIDFPGSSITYKPPPGTRQVYYSFKFSIGRYDDHNSMGYKFFIDGTEVTSFKRYDGMNGNYGQGFLSFDCVIEIGGTNDIPNGKLSSWNTLKTLKVQVAQEDNYGFWLNKSFYDIQQGDASNNADTSHNSSTYVRKPSLKVEAIGDGPGIVPSSGMNVVTANFSTAQTVTIPHALPGYHVSELDLVIKPTATDSVIELKFNLFCDFNENVCFRIKRNDDFVVTAAQDGEGALSVAVYDNNEVSTPFTHTVRWYDQPNTTSEITYKLYVNTSESGHNNQSGWINRAGSSGDDHEETGTSTAIAIEYPKTARPLDTENALTIPPFVGAINKEKLYNQSGDLYFNGKQLSNEWYKNGGDLYRLGANVGIGKSSPSYKLDVTGDINFTGNLRQNGSEYIGIGTTSPSVPFEVAMQVDVGAPGTVAYLAGTNGGTGHTALNSSHPSRFISIKSQGTIWAGGWILAGSDRRIKENIEDVNSIQALTMLRNIPCRYYEYRDKIKRGSGKVIGFIAQEVKSVLPMAIDIQTEIIPNVYKIISCEWKGNVMYSQELGIVSGVKYKFYVGNTDKDETERIVTGNSDNTFTFEQQWNNVFCFGKEINDFHTIDKQKLCALNFSATQELDRQQQADKAKITSLETKVQTLEATLASQQTLIQSLMTRLEALENP